MSNSNNGFSVNAYPTAAAGISVAPNVLSDLDDVGASAPGVMLECFFHQLYQQSTSRVLPEYQQGTTRVLPEF